MRKITIIFIFTALLMLLIIARIKYTQINPNFKIRSIDTVKFSRDLSREKLYEKSFYQIIDKQIKNIAETNANYVAISTPYDNEFLPYLNLWVKAARKYKLKVWFRGNWSGWEGWFGYPQINKEEHLNKTKQFILNNKSLFENEDIFTSCTECENGISIDPRKTGDVENFRNFLIDEYKINQESFNEINKNVYSNYFSMNLDVAKIVMNKSTTKKLGNIVVIDHYVANPQKLKNDVEEITNVSGGKIVLGEFGAPIPNITGDMTEEEQSKWIEDAFNLLSNTPELIGVNYWTNMGASTRLWNDDGSARLVVNVIKKYFLN